MDLCGHIKLDRFSKILKLVLETTMAVNISCIRTLIFKNFTKEWKNYKVTCKPEKVWVPMFMLI